MIVTKESINQFQNNSLERVLFEKLDTIRLSQSKYLIMSFLDFSVHEQPFLSALMYRRLLLENAQKLIHMTYPNILLMKEDKNI